MSEDVGGQDEERLVGEAVDRRDRVEGEEQVGRAEREDDDEHRRDQPLAALDDREPGAVPRRQLDGRVDEERAEEVEDPRVRVDHHGAQGDEDAAQDDRDDDADHERGLLQLLRHLEAGHDEQEHEEVVDRQGVLGQPPGVELAGVLPAPLEPDEQPEEDGGRHVEREVAPGLGHRGHVRSP
jgi:hypothetical protein